MSMPPEASVDPILTIDEAAAYLAIPKATLYTWRTRRVGFGPRALKIGGSLRFRRSDLDDWVLAHLGTFETVATSDREDTDAPTALRHTLLGRTDPPAKSESLRGKRLSASSSSVMSRRRSRR